MDNLDGAFGTADHAGPQALSERVTFRSLTLEERLALVWGWWWRQMLVGLLAALVALIPFIVIGIIMGVAAGLKGVDGQRAIESAATEIQVAGFLLGAVVGFLSFSLSIRWLTTARIGSFELHIVRIAQEPGTATIVEDSQGDLVCDACGSPVSPGQEFCPGCAEKLEFDQKG